MPNPDLDKPLLVQGEEACKTLFDTMNYAGGYQLNWGQNNELDLGKIVWDDIEASAAMIWQGETNTDNDVGGHQDAYQNYAEYLIQIAIPLQNYESNAKIAHRRLAARAIDDLKKLFGANPSPGGVWEDIQYMRSEAREADETSGDILQIAYIDTYWEVRYSQDRNDPTTIAS